MTVVYLDAIRYADHEARRLRSESKEADKKAAKLAQEALGPLVQNEEPDSDFIAFLKQRILDLEAIIKANPGPAFPAQKLAIEIAERHGLSYRDLRGHRRDAKVCAARCEAMWQIRKNFPHFSMPMIGRIFNRDHTTVLYALRKYASGSGRSKMRFGRGAR